MSITETARKNHEALFPGHEPAFQSTDPDLVEIFGNFAFDEILSHGHLDPRLRQMAILAALIALQSSGGYRIMLRAALSVGVTPAQIQEIVYQAVPYCGMARVFEVLASTSEVLAASGLELPRESRSTTTRQTRCERGLALQKALFGPAIDALNASTPPDQQHINRFLSANCFGDHLTREGLDLPTRELLTFSMLLAMAGCESQLKAHILANLKLGNHREVLLDTLTQLLPFIGYPRTLNALRCLNEAAPAKTQAKEGPQGL